MGAVGLDDIVMRDIKNSCWKESRGQADWVIVADMDELLWCDAPGLDALTTLKTMGISIVQPVGFNLISETMPIRGIPITNQVRLGKFDPNFCKCILFNPNDIDEINYEAGAHRCHPTGSNVRLYQSNGWIKLLHYHHLTLEHILKRRRDDAIRINKENLANGLGVQNSWPLEVHERDFKNLLAAATRVI
jgi:hypothetical protein